MKRQALAALSAHRNQKDFRLDLLALNLKGHSKGFDKLVGMIDDMVVLLGKEQDADSNKKGFCEAELDKAEDKKKGLDTRVGDLAKAIDDAKGSIDSLADEVASLAAGIEALDKSVAEATAMRKQEHQDNAETVASDSAAKQLLNIARNRLAKFYTPKLYKPAPKAELSGQDAIAVSMGGTLE